MIGSTLFLTTSLIRLKAAESVQWIGGVDPRVVDGSGGTPIYALSLY